MAHVLYLASNSVSRKNLLEQAKIPCQIIQQTADEEQVSREQSFEQIVMQIAKLKMMHAVLPDGQEHGELAFVLTADTMGLTASNRLLGKPKDRSDAISMLKACQQGPQTTKTGFCIRKLEWKNHKWYVLAEILDVDSSSLLFDVPDPLIDFYLDNIPFMEVSGAVSIEQFGGQFCKSINGSYESIIGLPMYTIRQALLSMEF